MSHGRVVLSLAVFILAVAPLGTVALRGQNTPAPPARNERVRLAEAKIALAKRALAYFDELFQLGRVGPDGHLQRGTWNRRLLDARLESTTDPAGRIQAAEQYVAECREIRDRLEESRASGRGSTALLVMQAEYELLEGETILANLKAP